MDTFPKDINLLPFNEAMEIYDTLRQAYLDGDEKKIEELRKKYPTLFDTETAQLLRETADCLEKMKKGRRKRKFTVH